MNKILRLFFMLALVAVFSVSCQKEELVPETFENAPKPEGVFTPLSPFDEKLMDLTGYLLSKEELLTRGTEKGIDYTQLLWDRGYNLNTREREYVIVPFAPYGKVFRLLVATKKDDLYHVFIREAPEEEAEGSHEARTYI